MFSNKDIIFWILITTNVITFYLLIISYIENNNSFKRECLLSKPKFYSNYKSYDLYRAKRDDEEADAGLKSDDSVTDSDNVKTQLAVTKSDEKKSSPILKVDTRTQRPVSKAPVVTAKPVSRNLNSTKNVSAKEHEEEEEEEHEKDPKNGSHELKPNDNYQVPSPSKRSSKQEGFFRRFKAGINSLTKKKFSQIILTQKLDELYFQNRHRN
jgi:FtsZ-interacting cell division protein ZipA